MITNCKKWHYGAVKKLSALLSGVTSKYDGDIYCLNCFHSYSTKNKLGKYEKVCNDNDYCYLEMPEEDNRILNKTMEKSQWKLHLLFMQTYSVYLKKCIHVKIILKHLIQKKSAHTFSLFIVYTFSFDSKKNMLDCYRGKECMKRFCKHLKEYSIKIINYEKKEMNH